MPSVYLETTIPSYLAARDSTDIRTLGKQQATREWWDVRRNDFKLFVSEAVLVECQSGDPDAVVKRLEVLEGIPLLEQKPPTAEVAEFLLARLSLPKKAAADAVHIAITIVNEVDFLLTWNCTHIANAAFRPIIEEAADIQGCLCPIICTPEELMERL
jgi:hypothetical protein